MVKIGGIEIDRGKQSTIRLLASGIVVFIDPYQVSGQGKADIILITHEHFDHCDPGSVKALRRYDTPVIGSGPCSSKVTGLRIAKPGDVIEDRGVRIEATDAYNINKPFHKKGQGLGYVITLSGKRIYHAGDTDRIPEMKRLGKIDIALVPIGGTYTMDAKEAARAVNEDIKPGVAIPIHYGGVVGSARDAEVFEQLCKVEVTIL